MMIDNREWTEPEIKAYMKNHEAQTEQLECIIDRLEAENKQLRERLASFVKEEN